MPAVQPNTVNCPAKHCLGASCSTKGFQLFSQMLPWLPVVQANTVNCSAVFRCNLLNQTPSVSPFQPKHFCWVDTSDQCHPFIQALPSVSAVKHCQLFSHALLSTVQPNTVSVNLFNKTPPLAVQPKAVSVTCTTKDSVSAVKTKQPMSQLLLSAVQPSHMLPITMHCQCQLSSQTLSAVQPNIAVSCSAKHCQVTNC